MHNIRILEISSLIIADLEHRFVTLSHSHICDLGDFSNRNWALLCYSLWDFKHELQAHTIQAMCLIQTTWLSICTGTNYPCFLLVDMVEGGLKILEALLDDQCKKCLIPGMRRMKGCKEKQQKQHGRRP